LLNDKYYKHYGQIPQYPDKYKDNFRAGLV
jgi:hypothetical protein